jgi:hypothetical protein
MTKEKMMMVALAQKLLDRAYGKDEPGKDLQEQKLTVDLHNQHSDKLLHPRALVYGLGRCDLLDLMELFCKWYAHADDKMELHQHLDLDTLMHNSEELYGALEGIEKVFYNTTKAIHKGRK